MRPISFKCSKIIPKNALEICANIEDVERWCEFKGYGILPGIAHAEYEHCTSDMVGSRVHVRNGDGSQHNEEFCEWEPGQKIVIRLYDFTPPLQHLATHFVEEWDFTTQNDATLVMRKFKLFPKHAVTRPVLWLISLLFKRAIARHLTEMSQA